MFHDVLSVARDQRDAILDASRLQMIGYGDVFLDHVAALDAQREHKPPDAIDLYL